VLELRRYNLAARRSPEVDERFSGAWDNVFGAAGLAHKKHGPELFKKRMAEYGSGQRLRRWGADRGENRPLPRMPRHALGL
jgi:hypothetical protein